MKFAPPLVMQGVKNRVAYRLSFKSNLHVTKQVLGTDRLHHCLVEVEIKHPKRSPVKHKNAVLFEVFMPSEALQSARISESTEKLLYIEYICPFLSFVSSLCLSNYFLVVCIIFIVFSGDCYIVCR